MSARSRHTCSTLMPRRSASVFAERSAIAVRTQPGSTALDVTPNGPASWATARASPITPCLEAVYALPDRSAFSPAVELVNTSRPKPRLHIPPTVRRASSNGPSRLMRIVSRQTSGSCSHTSRSCAEPMPWFTTRRSIGPNRSSVSETASAHPSGVPRSAATYSSPTADSSSTLRATTITRAPAADSSSAASRPIPRPPPVTSATRPFIHQLPYLCSRNRPTLGCCAQSFQKNLNLLSIWIVRQRVRPSRGLSPHGDSLIGDQDVRKPLTTSTTLERDFQRQNALNPRRYQQISVSGLMIATASTTDGHRRYSQKNTNRLGFVSRVRPGAC